MGKLQEIPGVGKNIEQDLSYMSQFQIIEYLGLPHNLEHLVLQH